MKDVVIVSTAGTGIGRAYKGILNATRSLTMLTHAIAQAVRCRLARRA
jgi:acetyl-CoA C-acetyltransferase